MGKYLKNILITGGLGYLGGRMTKYFSDNRYSVLITTRRLEKDFPKNIPVNTSVVQVDYKSDEQLKEAMKGIDTLIHLAGPDAHTISNDTESRTRKHVELTGRLLRSAIVNSVKKFMEVFGQKVKTKSEFPSDKIVQLRYDLIKEELDEFALIVMNTKIAYQEELVDVCQEMIKNINNRGFVIKNSIDFMRFTMGA